MKRVAVLGAVVALLIGSSCGNNQPPDSPVLSLSTSFSTSASGTISACHDPDDKPDGTCTLSVFAVAADAPPTDPPIAGPVSVPSPGGTWQLSGIQLGEGQPYTIWGTASDGAKIGLSEPLSAVTNASPESPDLFGLSAPNNQTIIGSMTPCSDADGFPSGSCQQEAFVLSTGDSCSSSCVCSGPIVASAPVASGTFAIVDSTGSQLKPDMSYRVYGRSDDGELASCSDGTDFVSTPATVDGCEKHTAIYLAQSPDVSGVRGVRATWKVKDAFAVDWQYGGFVQSAILMGVNQKSIQFMMNAESLEAGVTRGFDRTNDHVYFTAWNNFEADEFMERRIPDGDATVGELVDVQILNCALDPPSSNCSAFDPSDSPFENVACVNEKCFTWSKDNLGALAPGPGTPDFWLGFESTCNSYPSHSGPPSRIDTTTIRDIQYRYLGSWANLHVLNPDPYLLKGPSPSSIHGTDCCNGLVPGTNDQCNAPLDFLFHFNSQTPKTCESF